MPLRCQQDAINQLGDLTSLKDARVFLTMIIVYRATFCVCGLFYDTYCQEGQGDPALMAFFLTRPKLTVFGIVPEAMDTYMVQFLGFWYRQRGQKWAFLASSKKCLRALRLLNSTMRFNSSVKQAQH